MALCISSKTPFWQNLGCHYLARTFGVLILIICNLGFAQTPSEITEVVVTGSLLPSEKSAFAPITEWDKEDLERANTFRLANFLEALPEAAKAPNTLATGGFSTLNAGLSTVDLRGLGASRSLVLVDGKRLIGGDPSNPTVADLNSIPAQMVERIEIYSGGATAVYGSGAIGGVINIITKPHYEGLLLNLDSGVSEHGDGKESSINIIGGSSFAQDKGQVTLTLGWDKNNAIWSKDRDFSKNNERLGDRAAFSPFTSRGTITSAQGVRVPNSQGLWLDTYEPLKNGYNQNSDRQLYVPLERIQGNLFASYQLNDQNKIYTQLGGSNNESSNQQEPSSLIINNRPEPLPSNYPFFPTEILDTWRNSGKAVPAQINYNRRLSELGPRRYEQQRESWRMLAGIESNWGQWHNDLSAHISHSDFSQISTGHYNTANLSYGLKLEADPTNIGQFRCISETARNLGCQPIDVFGAQGISREALDFIRAEQTTDASLTMHEVQWQLNGPLFTLPAGDLNFLMGADWRKEHIESSVDALTQTGLTSSVSLSPVNGRDETRELFSETHIPVLKDTWVKALDLSLAYRHSDYETSGTAQSWNGALNISPISNVDMYLRRSLAVRAPSISELYLPPRGGFLSITDPCATSATVPASTREKCRSLGIPDNYTPTAQELSVPYRVQGNAQLQEETGYTTTLGAAFRPWQTDALTLRVDYFDIDIHNAIVNIDPTFKINSCYGAADFPDNYFCRGLTRGTGAQNYRFTQLDFGLENIGSFQTRGEDFEIASSLSLLGGTLSNRLLATHTNRWQQTANNKTLNRLGEPGLQKWKGSYALGFDKGPWQTAINARFLGSGAVENDSTQAYIRANNNLPAVSYFDAYLGYVFTDAHSAEGKTRRIYLSVHNLADKEPPYVPGDSRNGNPGTSTTAGVYDVRGRFWRLGVEYGF